MTGNGKKKLVYGGLGGVGGGVSIVFLIRILLSFNTVATANATDLVAQEKRIVKVENKSEQVGAIKADVENIKGDVGELKSDMKEIKQKQETFLVNQTKNKIILDEIRRAVVKE